MPAVLTERIGHVLVVTLNRPDRMNAINGEVLVRFYDAMVEADTDDDIRVAIITGAGDNFCAGADLKEMAGGHQGEDLSGVDVQGRLAADPDLPWKALLRTWRPNVPLITAAEARTMPICSPTWDSSKNRCWSSAVARIAASTSRSVATS